ncbi:hypothetical protein B9Z38_04475 [Limnohabitans sp. MMS-10A-160]|uniref:hypothetical protein n=1 Tax=unclassified Limnohabitans TaxID=2626134 RepID=UPI000D3B193F|nr:MULTISPECIES: hypothetical protein [unclassified Limnohabitans]PUE21987.1 hypothetical protein B9Z43_02140 [Limnohabitans sp. MMS-10A-192]PUE25638.1 hypothetical protein B9Z38_04475 [Limnohabitans sp. MMS-10A-160]
MTESSAPNALPLTDFSGLALRAPDHARLSPAQKRFNELLARIEVLTHQVQRLQAWSDRHRHAHVQALYTAAQQARELRKSLLLFLHEQLHSADLTAQQQRMARNKLRSLLDLLSPLADPQVQALADLYADDEVDQEEAQELAEAAERVRAKIEAALGQPIDNPSQYRTPEAMVAAGMRQWQRQQEADDDRKAAKRAARKAKNKPGAEKAEVQQTDAKTALRTIYRQLASALHPDREPDEQERQRKTSWMSEVNAAYEKADLSTLMRLQMQVTQVDPQASARMADDKLQAMCLLLKEQVSALEDDLDQMQFRLSRELCIPVRADADEAAMTQALQRMQADQRHEVESLQSDLRRIAHEAELKRWLKEQAQLAKEKARQEPAGWWD